MPLRHALMHNMRRRYLAALPACLCLIMLAACDSGSRAALTPTPQAAESTAMTATASAGTSTVSGQPGKGDPMEAKLVDFQIWQDHMPSIGREGPPLYASLTIDVTNGARLNAA